MIEILIFQIIYKIKKYSKENKTKRNMIEFKIDEENQIKKEMKLYFYKFLGVLKGTEK